MDRTLLKTITFQMMGMAKANLKRDGYLAFVVMAMGKDGSLTPILARGQDSHAIRGMLEPMLPRLDAVVVVTEAWMSEVDAREVETCGRPSEAANRKECVVVTGQARCGEWVLTAEMKKNKSPKAVKEAWTEKGGSRPCQTNLQGLFA